MEHTIAIAKTWFNLYCQLEKERTDEWYRSVEKSGSVAGCRRFGHEVMVALAMDIRGISCYEILVSKTNECQSIQE